MLGTLARPAATDVVVTDASAELRGSTLLTRPAAVPGADVLSATDTLEQALAVGLLDADDVLAGRAWVLDVSGSHRVHLVGTGGEASAVVKTPGSVSVLDGDDPVRAERVALRHLAGSGLTPQLLLDDPAKGPAGDRARALGSSARQLWTAAVPGEVLAARGGAGATSTGEPFAAWGATLAALHRLAVRGGEPVAPLPWVLAHPAVAPGHLGGRAAPTAIREVLAQVQARTVLADALRSLAASWRSACWVHGDASPANAIVRPGDDGAVVLVDLEHAGLGDPDWDVATALDGIDTITPDAALAEARREQLLSAYRTAGGPGRLDPRHLAVRAVLSAVRHATGDAGSGWETPCGTASTAAVDRAEALASTHPEPASAACRHAHDSGETS